MHEPPAADLRYALRHRAAAGGRSAVQAGPPGTAGTSSRCSATSRSAHGKPSSGLRARSWTACKYRCWPFQATTTSPCSTCGPACNAPMPATALRSARNSSRCTVRPTCWWCASTPRGRWRHKHGEVSAAQVDRVARLLEVAEPTQLRIVVVHQPVAVNRGRRPAEPSARPCGGARALGRRRGRPRHGRAHPSTLRPAVARPGASAVGRAGGHRRLVPGARGRAQLGEPAALGRAVRPPGCCRIEQWDYAADVDEFTRARVSEVRPARTAGALA